MRVVCAAGAGVAAGVAGVAVRARRRPNNACNARFASCTPTISTGHCPPIVAGPYAAWMPRKRLHGRTCGVSCDGRRARAL
ncbi:hypothetical protein FPL04_19600 [Xanthomonas arboricola]|nr:hypothetical protein FPL04_19600 [Xanthomonas arboricola]